MYTKYNSFRVVSRRPLVLFPARSHRFAGLLQETIKPEEFGVYSGAGLQQVLQAFAVPVCVLGVASTITPQCVNWRCWQAQVIDNDLMGGLI
jgi:hypothetical protein